MEKPCSSFSCFSVSLLLSLFTTTVLAADPDFLQDVCVADLNSNIKVNGFPCKAEISADDFSFKGLANPGSTNTTMGSVVTGANVEKFPGLNTLGVSLARIDYAPDGLNPPHTHPRATEIIFVLEGELEVGFITTSNKLFTKNITKGEVFVFPRGLVHFQKNNGQVPAATTKMSSSYESSKSLCCVNNWTLYEVCVRFPTHSYSSYCSSRKANKIARSPRACWLRE